MGEHILLDSFTMVAVTQMFETYLAGTGYFFEEVTKGCISVSCSYLWKNLYTLFLLPELRTDRNEDNSQHMFFNY